MSSKNDITGDRLTSKPNNKAYEDNWERICGKKKQEENKDVSDNIANTTSEKDS